jgi:hypothetical protein
VVILIIILIPAALLLIRARKDRSSEDERARVQRLDYQPAAKPVPVARPVPVAKPVQAARPVSPAIPVPANAPARMPEPATIPETDLTGNSRDLRESLCALAGKYSLDSVTIATSDGLVLAASGGSTTQEDAASYSRLNIGGEPEGVTLFVLNHKGSELTGIIRSQGIITGEVQKRIESDTKDILNRWI